MAWDTLGWIAVGDGTVGRVKRRNHAHNTRNLDYVLLRVVLHPLKTSPGRDEQHKVFRRASAHNFSPQMPETKG